MLFGIMILLVLAGVVVLAIVDWEKATCIMLALVAYIVALILIV